MEMTHFTVEMRNVQTIILEMTMPVIGLNLETTLKAATEMTPSLAAMNPVQTITLKMTMLVKMQC